jgi:hypothetical protein
MLIWAAYVILVSTALSLAAFMIERIALLRRMPARWVWAGSIAACLLLPIIISSVSLPLPGLLRHDLPVPATHSLPLREMTSNALSPALWLNDTIGPADAQRDTGSLLGHLWLAASAIMLLGLAAGNANIQLRKRRWLPGTMCGAAVYIAEDAGPAIVGFFRPHIVVPRWLRTCPAEEQELVILHETSHLQARDAQLLALTLLFIATMPWNLPLWWQLKRLRYAIELDCDARVLRHGKDIARYGNVLITVGARRAGSLVPAAAMSESGVLLERRIHHMLRAPSKIVSLSVLTAACLAACFAVIATQIRPPNALAAAATERFTATAIPAVTATSPAAGQPVSVSADTLDHYVGYYHMFGNVVMTVTRNGHQLLAGIPGQPTFPVYASAPARFYYKVVKAELTFMPDAQGRVTAVVLHQDGNDFTFTRIDAATAQHYATVLAARIHDQQPDPRSREILLSTIASIARDRPDFTGMPADQVALAKKNVFNNKNLVHDFTGFENLDTLKFLHVNAIGVDVYELRQGVATWYFDIGLDSNGQVIIFNPWVRRDGVDKLDDRSNFPYS